MLGGSCYLATVEITAQICTFKTLRVSLVNHRSQLHFPQLHILKTLPTLSQPPPDILLCILAAIQRHVIGFLHVAYVHGRRRGKVARGGSYRERRL